MGLPSRHRGNQEPLGAEQAVGAGRVRQDLAGSQPYEPFLLTSILASSLL